jgi:hypothetical protein
MATTYFWRCLRCRLLHFTVDAPAWCEHCGCGEFILVLIGISESRAPASPAPAVA